MSNLKQNQDMIEKKKKKRKNEVEKYEQDNRSEKGNKEHLSDIEQMSPL